MLAPGPEQTPREEHDAESPWATAHRGPLHLTCERSGSGAGLGWQGENWGRLEPHLCAARPPPATCSDPDRSSVRLLANRLSVWSGQGWAPAGVWGWRREKPGHSSASLCPAWGSSPGPGNTTASRRPWGCCRPLVSGSQLFRLLCSKLCLKPLPWNCPTGTVRPATRGGRKGPHGGLMEGQREAELGGGSLVCARGAPEG